MYRLIYFDSVDGYDTLDFVRERDILDCVVFLQRDDQVVVCIVDYKLNTIKEKCINFEEHKQYIDHYL
jgi:hypothetical protein